MIRPWALRLLTPSTNYLNSMRWKAMTVELPENWNNAKPFKSIPGPVSLPIIGSAWRFLGGNFMKTNHEMRKQYGDVHMLRNIISFGDIVLIFNIHDIEWVLRNEGPWPVRDSLKSSLRYRHVLRKDVFGDTYGLSNGQNEDWASFRTAVNPIMMQPRTTHQYISQINDIADEFMVRVQNLKMKNANSEMPDDFIDEINKWTFESITAIALDTRLGCLDDNPSEKAQKAIEYILESFQLIMKLDFMPMGKYHIKYDTKTWKRFVTCQDYFTNMTLELIEAANERIKNDPNYANKPEQDKSVFEKLVAKDKKVAMVMILDMLGAGIDTTAKVCGACLYFLAKSPDAQNKLREELIRLLPTKNTPITKEVLEEAKYLRACIKESMRIAPIGSGNIRRTTKSMVIGGYQVPAGVMIMLPHLYLSIGVDEHYTNPTEYKPERWLRDGKSEIVNAFASLPFGFGPRSCIGKRMANMEIEVLIAKMVRNYVMEWPHKDMTFKQELLYGIADPLKIKLTEVSD